MRIKLQMGAGGGGFLLKNEAESHSSYGAFQDAGQRKECLAAWFLRKRRKIVNQSAT